MIEPESLAHYTEGLRRELYDAVVSLVWTAAGPEDHVPGFTAAEAGLAVVYTCGRWFAVWQDLEEERTAPEDLRTVLVRILAAPESPFEIVLQEV